MRELENVGITFATRCVVVGLNNNVINVTLAADLFSPQGDAVEHDPAIVARLRMDIPCALALFNQLGGMLAKLPQLAASPPLPSESPEISAETMN